MTEDYATKAKRWRNLRSRFPTPLRNIPLRYVSSVNNLSESQMGQLSKAVSLTSTKETKNFLGLLMEHPDMNAKDMLSVLQMTPTDIAELVNETAGEKGKTTVKNSDKFPDPLVEIQEEDVDVLAHILREGFPSMPQAAAESLALAKNMKDLLVAVAATRTVINGNHTDFGIISMYLVFRGCLIQLAQIINGNIAFTKAIEKIAPEWGEINLLSKILEDER